MPIKCCKCSRQCDGKTGLNQEYIIYKGNYSNPGASGYRFGSGYSFYYCCNCAKADGWDEFAEYACPRCSNKPSSAEAIKSGTTQVEILGNAHREADKIKKDAVNEAARLLEKARLERDQILEGTKLEATKILEEAKLEAAKLLEEAKSQAAKAK